MKNTSTLLKIFVGAIVTLGGIVCIGMHAIFTYLVTSGNSIIYFENHETSAIFIRTMIAFIICGFIQLVNGILIIINSKAEKPKKMKKITFILNIIIVAVSAVLMIPSSLCKENLIAVQMLTGIIIPVLYFAVYFITSPQGKQKSRKK